MAEGCKEKFDLEFAKWILWDGRRKSAKERYKGLISKYGDKAIVIKKLTTFETLMSDFSEILIVVILLVFLHFPNSYNQLIEICKRDLQ